MRERLKHCLKYPHRCFVWMFQSASAVWWLSLASSAFLALVITIAVAAYSSQRQRNANCVAIEKVRAAVEQVFLNARQQTLRTPPRDAEDAQRRPAAIKFYDKSLRILRSARCYTQGDIR